MKKLKIIILAFVIVGNCAFYGNCQKRETEDFDAVLQKCAVIRDKGENQNAVECFEKAREINPDNYSLQVALATSYKAINKLDNAEQAIKKALELCSECDETHYIYAHILEKKGKFREAITEYQTAVKLNPKDYLFWMSMAKLQDKLGDTDDAIFSFEKVLELKPDYDLALDFLGNLYFRKGDVDKGIEIFEKLFEISPEYEKEGKEQLEKIKRERNKQKKAKTKAAGNSL